MCTRNASRALTRLEPFTIWVRPNESSPCSDDKTTKLCANLGSQANPALFDDVLDLLQHYDPTQTVLVNMSSPGTYGNPQNTYDFTGRNLVFSGAGSSLTRLFGKNFLFGSSTSSNSSKGRLNFNWKALAGGVAIGLQSTTSRSARNVLNDTPPVTAVSVNAARGDNVNFRLEDAILEQAQITGTGVGSGFLILEINNSQVTSQNMTALNMLSQDKSTVKVNVQNTTFIHNDETTTNTKSATNNSASRVYSSADNSTMSVRFSNVNSDSNTTNPTASASVAHSAIMDLKDDNCSYKQSGRGDVIQTRATDNSSMTMKQNNSDFTLSSSDKNTAIFRNTASGTATTSHKRTNCEHTVVGNGQVENNTAGDDTTVVSQLANNTYNLPPGSTGIQAKYSGTSNVKTKSTGESITKGSSSGQNSRQLEDDEYWCVMKMFDNVNVESNTQNVSSNIPLMRASVTGTSTLSNAIGSSSFDGPDATEPFIQAIQSESSTVSHNVSAMTTTGSLLAHDATTTNGDARTTIYIDGVSADLQNYQCVANIKGGQGICKSALSNVNANQTGNSSTDVDAMPLFQSMNQTNDPREQQTLAMTSVRATTSADAAMVHVIGTSTNIFGGRYDHAGSESTSPVIAFTPGKKGNPLAVKYATLQNNGKGYILYYDTPPQQVQTRQGASDSSDITLTGVSVISLMTQPIYINVDGGAPPTISVGQTEASYPGDFVGVSSLDVNLIVNSSASNTLSVSTQLGNAQLQEVANQFSIQR